MAITGAYNFKGIALPNAYLRIGAITGDKRAGWTGRVGVFADAVAAADVTDDGVIEGTGATIPVTRTPAPLEEVSISVGYDATKSPYTLLYEALLASPLGVGMVSVSEPGQTP